MLARSAPMAKRNSNARVPVWRAGEHACCFLWWCSSLHMRAHLFLLTVGGRVFFRTLLRILRYEKRHARGRKEQKGNQMDRDYTKGIFNEKLQGWKKIHPFPLSMTEFLNNYHDQRSFFPLGDVEGEVKPTPQYLSLHLMVTHLETLDNTFGG